MKTRSYFLLFVILIGLTFCTSKTSKKEVTILSHSDLITISGAYAMAPIMQVWMNEYQKSHPYVKFKLNVNGSGQGLDELLSGKTDLAMVSEDIPKAKDTQLWIVPLARLGVVPVISAKNPYLKTIMAKGLSMDNLSDIFSGKSDKTWGDLAGTSGKDPIKVYIRGDASGATATLAKYLSMEARDIKGVPVSGETALLDQVKNDPFALSYCNSIYAFDTDKKAFLADLKVVPIKKGKEKPEESQKTFDTYEHLQRAMWLGTYPSALIRDLNLVSKGKPRTREMVDFIYWIITDGQRLVADNGYIELHSAEVQSIGNSIKAMIQ
jgi:phosphate transport system substrate-binding protein